MRTENTFWDSSALVPLCVQQSSSQDFWKLLRRTNRIIIWSGTVVEIRSALARLRRTNEIDSRGFRQSITRLEAIRGQWREVVMNEKLYSIAEDLPDAYALKALDSFQLAAALVWCKENPKGRLFACDDDRLSEAAQKVGFSVVP